MIFSPLTLCLFLWSGLSAAYKLKLHGLNVTVFEADGRVGGKLRSICGDGLIWDEGANTMVLHVGPSSHPSLHFIGICNHVKGAYIDKFYFVGRLKVRHLLGFCSTILALGISNNLYGLLDVSLFLRFNMFILLFTFFFALQVVYLFLLMS